MTENKPKKKIRNDIIFIGALLLVLVIIGVIILAFGKTGFFTGKTGNVVKVTVDGELYGTYSLETDQTVEIKTANGYNILVIEGGEARVKEASCPDGVCSDHKPIDIIGESIICLPNKVVITVESEEGTVNEDPGLDIVS